MKLYLISRVVVLLIACSTVCLFSISVYGASDSIRVDLRVESEDGEGNEEYEEIVVATTSKSDKPQSIRKTPIEIFGFKELASPTSLILRWNTTMPVQATIRWGLTPDGELGSLSHVSYRELHQVVLNDLNPLGRYYVIVGLRSEQGAQRTLNLLYDINELSLRIQTENVSNPRLISGLQNIVLRWDNPRGIDRIRIVRTVNRPSRDPQDGYIVYEGNSNSFIDTSIRKDEYYFYTIYSYFPSGSISSGVILHGQLLRSIINDEKSNELNTILTSVDSLIISSELAKKRYHFIQQEGFMYQGQHLIVIEQSLPFSINITLLPEDVGIYAIATIYKRDSRGNMKEVYSTNLSESLINGYFSSRIPAHLDEGLYSYEILIYDSREGQYEIVEQSFYVQGIDVSDRTISPTLLSVISKEFLAFLSLVILIFLLVFRFISLYN
jgi:hypothetical protein